MTNEADRERMLDVIRSKNFPTRKEAKEELEKSGHYNKGIQKALDAFYDIYRFKNGGSIQITKTGKVIARTKTGQIRSLRGLERFINELKGIEKKKK